MKFQFYLEKLEDLDAFKEYKKENSDAFLCSGFFAIDEQGDDNQQHLDFYSPSTGKAFSFQLEKDNPKVPLDDFGDNVPEELSEEIDFDFEEVKQLIKDEMDKNEVKNNVTKYLFSLQKQGGKNYIIGTVFLSKMGLLKAIADLDEKKVTEFEKKSLFDMLSFREGKKNKGSSESGSEESFENKE
ncbi:MAG: hypothetical protein ABEI74_04915 [Candidatus Pacearchaeota archaeon]